MDVISVTSESLNNSLILIKQFEERVDEMVTSCKTDLQDQFGGIDDALKKDLNAYIELLSKTKEKIKLCIDENSVAIYERQAKLAVYENISYNKVNIKV